MRIHSRSVPVVAAGLLFVSAVPASADLIEFSFGGSVLTVASIGAPFDPIAIGNPYTLSYVFDSDTFDTDLSAVGGSYGGAIQSFTLSIGSASFTGAPAPPPPGFPESGKIGVNTGTDGYEAFMYGVGPGVSFGVGVSFTLLAGLATDVLPTDLTLSDFGFGGGPPLAYFSAGGEGGAASITSFRSRVVPVPGSALLGAVGFGMVGWLRRRSLT